MARARHKQQRLPVKQVNACLCVAGVHQKKEYAFVYMSLVHLSILSLCDIPFALPGTVHLTRDGHWLRAGPRA